jgi:hypothetical protein
MLDAVLSERIADRRLLVMLMVGFGALALLLASVGVYAMFASMAPRGSRSSACAWHWRLCRRRCNQLVAA